MTSDQAKGVLRLVAGHWPNPEMGEDEIRVWCRTLARLDVALAIDVVDAMATTGRNWRPTDGQFFVEYRQASNRLPKPYIDRGERQLEVTTERLTVDEWRQRIREQIDAARGPLVEDLAASVGAEP